MNIRKTRLGFATLLWVAAPFVPPAAAHSGPSVNVTINSDRVIESCADVRVSFDERDAARAEDSFEIPAGAPLSVKLPEHSGIQVNGEKRGGFGVTVCKAARRPDALDGIHVSRDGAGIAFRGPTSGDWMVFLIVRAPRDAALDLEAKNGPIGVVGVSGKVAARTANGPISLEGCSGPLDANAVNGPISLERCSGTGDARAINGPIDFSGSRGTYRLDTKNGPISVELEGNRWEAGSLDAHAVNGPLSLKISNDYSSAVRLEMLGHGPVTCPSSICRSARKAWDDDSRTIEFGEAGSDPVVRLSTQNGPVSVAPAR
jgi:hypothetical protein